MVGIVTKTFTAFAGKTVERSGFDCGLFFVHRVMPCSLNNKVAPVWSLTLSRSGAQLPYFFLRAEAAKAFAQEIEPLADWGAMQVAPAVASHVAEWVAGMPTGPAKAAIYAKACARGAFFV